MEGNRIGRPIMYKKAKEMQKERLDVEGWLETGSGGGRSAVGAKSVSNGIE